MITPKRVWMFGLALLLANWGAYAYRVSTPHMYDRYGVYKGADYRHFYVLGRLALQRNAAGLYDERAQVALARAEFEPGRSDSFGTPSHGPQVALFFAPLALLPYLPSWLLFAALSAACYLACARWVARDLRRIRSHGRLLTLLLIANPAFVALITFGQAAAIGLFALTLALEGWRRGPPVLVGIGVGLLCYKPTLALAPVLLLLFTAQWRALVVASIVAAVQLGAGAAYFGPDVLGTYVTNLLTVARQPGLNEPHPELLHSFKGALTLGVGYGGWATGINLVLCGAALWALRSVWTRSESHACRVCALCLCIVLISPHLTVYDLVMLTPGLVLMAEESFRHADGKWAMFVAAVYLTPLLGPVLAHAVRIQPSVLVMAAFLGYLYKQSTASCIPADTVEAV